ncbi:N-(5'-phosphoribosyl)anthranilate isomerase (fragment) [uncultured Desulfobacterium sp.]|uniref:N-(5'-phosphoribosyl)anthranilate isomerase n=1 Tax=uncultured Desulfobacterium sp. TaxID=201089 RepID=A0A445N0J7_9BACT
MTTTYWGHPHKCAMPLKEVCLMTNGTGVKNSLIPLFKEPDVIYKAVDYYHPHFVHFCETLTDKKGARINPALFIQVQSELKKRFPEIGIIRSIPVPPKVLSGGFPTLEIAAELEAVSDLFLTDTWLGEEPVEGYIGITGKTVDRRMAGRLVSQSRIPVILAGGLSPFNVYDALIDTRAAGADSCTHTNMLDGNGNPVRFKKDFAKVQRFVAEVRRAGEAIGAGSDVCKANRSDCALGASEVHM